MKYLTIHAAVIAIHAVWFLAGCGKVVGIVGITWVKLSQREQFFPFNHLSSLSWVASNASNCCLSHPLGLSLISVALYVSLTCSTWIWLLCCSCYAVSVQWNDFDTFNMEHLVCIPSHLTLDFAIDLILVLLLFSPIFADIVWKCSPLAQHIQHSIYPPLHIYFHLFHPYPCTFHLGILLE